MFRTMVLLLILWMLLIFFATSCATMDKPEYLSFNSKCTTRIELRNGTYFEYPIDLDNLIRAEQSCINHFGEKSCLSAFIKVSKQSYYAVCVAPDESEEEEEHR